MKVGVLFGTIVAILCASACASPSSSKSHASLEDALQVEVHDGMDALVPLPGDALRKCEDADYIRDLCPLLVPKADGSEYYRSLVSDDKETPGYRLLSVEWDAPSLGLSARNAPPRFAHLIVWAGDLERAFAFEEPGEITPLDVAIHEMKEDPSLLARPHWAGREGSLLLAPSYPTGGMNGDHLIYRWSEGGEEYAISLHAWKPVPEAIGLLREMVLSIRQVGGIEADIPSDHTERGRWEPRAGPGLRHAGWPGLSRSLGRSKGGRLSWSQRAARPDGTGADVLAGTLRSPLQMNQCPPFAGGHIPFSS